MNPIAPTQVYRGSSPSDPEKHTTDGDTAFITFNLKDTSVRLLSIDAPEITELNLKELEKSGFLSKLNGSLRSYLQPKLNKNSVKTCKILGLEAQKTLESILQWNLTLTFDREVYDRYGRMLADLSVNGESLILNMVEKGYAIPYLIYPNAVSPSEEGKFFYYNFWKYKKAALEACKEGLGIWPYLGRILLPTEVRYLMRREVPLKYCADVENKVLYSPQCYFKVSIENRLFFYPRDVLIALQIGFEPTTDCDSWLHEVWFHL